MVKYPTFDGVSPGRCTYRSANNFELLQATSSCSTTFADAREPEAAYSGVTVHRRGRKLVGMDVTGTANTLSGLVVSLRL